MCKLVTSWWKARGGFEDRNPGFPLMLELFQVIELSIRHLLSVVCLPLLEPPALAMKS
jgi:hypothetical protein